MAGFYLTDCERSVSQPLLATKVGGVKRADDRKAVERAARAKDQTVSDWIRGAMMAALEARA